MKQDVRPDVIVTRHFATPLNERSISRGWMSTGIDKEAAEKIVPRVAETLKKYGVDSLISSTLPRSRESMDLIAREMGGDVETEATPRLKTWNTGDKVAGKPEKETIPLREKYIKNSDVEMPGGESWDDFMDRFGVELKDFQKRRAAGENVAMVGHGHHLLAVPALLTDQPVDPKKLASLDREHEPGGVYGFFLNGGKVSIERLDQKETESVKSAA